ncbi:apolipoprotein N-acyltransferase [Chlorobium sp. BLA1]|uniref:apolipoprotein N-acyltransferase n=1 Tax=Candidatus Chlorobium masyuteum TaxID=2716876 RepID=UPI00141DCDE9|nr:apolipoprotein N-acyltransferase [Candidatus Chlorobium masyuteum]NHQ59010.1 apolipoprotein N-acyltransferase [Candidatus Chlorobium masyuteum]
MTSFSLTVKKLIHSRFLPSLWSGTLLGLSFPSYPFIHLELLAWVALVPLLLSFQRDEPVGEFFRRVYLSMLLFCTISLWWVSLATLPGGVLTIIAQAFFLTVPLLGFYALKRLAGFRYALISLPFLWVAWEWLYMQQDLSLGWLTFGNSQSALNFMIQYADLTGVWGISFWLLSFNILVLLAVTGNRREVILSVSAMSFMIALPLLYSTALFYQESPSERNLPKLRVTLIQPDIDPHKKWGIQHSSDIMERYYQLTGRAVRENRPELVIWPETAIPFYILDSPYAADLLSLRGSLRRWNTALLTGYSDIVRYPEGSLPRSENPGKFDTALRQPYETYNASMLLVPGERPPQIYRKMRLVPFAERVPYVEYLPWLGNFTFSLAGISSWGRGSESTVMELPSAQYGKVLTANIICYESIFPGLVTGFVRNGAQFLTLVTNDGWYSTSYGPYQHLAIGRIRCIENRRAMARCANTGLTVFIDKFGRITAELPWWQELTLTADVPLESRLTFYTRNPDLLPKVASVISVVLVGVAFFRKGKGY